MTDQDEINTPREIAVVAPALPSALATRLTGFAWHRNLVGEAGAIVYRLHQPHRVDAPALYLKHGDGAAAIAIAEEFARLQWLAGQWTVPRVEHFEWSDRGAWLLTHALSGRTAYEWLTDAPEHASGIVESLGRFLRRLHALPVETCPFNANHLLQLGHARQRLAAGLIDAEDFDEARLGWTPRQVLDAIDTMLPFEEDAVVSHGDFSLDNILMRADGEVVGVIDVGRAGIADRYRDLAILANCLDEFDPALRDTFFSAYGLAAPDTRKIDFHLLLDECF